MVSLQEREQARKWIVEGLYGEGMILTWHRNRPQGWTLASGLWSPYYINLRLLSSFPELYRLVGAEMGLLVKELGYEPNGRDRVVGVAMAGIPIANAITLLHGIPSLYTRKLPDDVDTQEKLKEYIESHGQHSLVEGEYRDGSRLVIVDDVVSRFDSKLMAINMVRQDAERKGVTQITLKDVVVLLDREQGGTERARELGYNLHSLVPFISRGLDWLRDRLTQVEHETIVDYVRNIEKYQDPELQQHLEQSAEQK